jgi:ferric-dicitrate binding protein FerR (iron transport regulator)
MDITPPLTSAEIDEASDWVHKFDSRCYGNSPPPLEEWVRFGAWLQADPRHARAYQDMKSFKDFVHQRLNPWPEKQQS